MKEVEEGVAGSMEEGEEGGGRSWKQGAGSRKRRERREEERHTTQLGIHIQAAVMLLI